MTISYRVYQEKFGCDLIFCGEKESLESAQELAESNPSGLSKSRWETARAAGQCTPEWGEEDDEPMSSHGHNDSYFVVRVTYRK